MSSPQLEFFYTSYNDITVDAGLRDFVGWAWYKPIIFQTTTILNGCVRYDHTFYVDSSWHDKRIMLRFLSLMCQWVPVWCLWSLKFHPKFLFLSVQVWECPLYGDGLCERTTFGDTRWRSSSIWGWGYIEQYIAIYFLGSGWTAFDFYRWESCDSCCQQHS